MDHAHLKLKTSLCRRCLEAFLFGVNIVLLLLFCHLTERTEKEKLETDAMFKLDHGGKDKEKLKKALPSLSEIQEYQSTWKDDFQLNSSLRRKFRVRQ